MEDKSLSQDEVDTLMSGLDESEGEQSANDADPEKSEAVGGNELVRSYDLASEGRILRGAMPTLELINTNFSKLFHPELIRLAGQSLQLDTHPVSVEKYADFVGALVVPGNLNVVQVSPLRGNGLIVIEPQLLGTIVDGLFGGSGALPIRLDGRKFSGTEKSIIGKIVGLVSQCYATAWKEFYPIELVYLRSEMQPQDINIAADTDLVLSTKISIELGGASGAIFICIPYTSFEPIRETLYAKIKIEQIEQDDSWLNKFGDQLELASVDLAAELAQTEISFGELLRLQPGDLIEMDVSEKLTACIDGIPFMRCTYGVNRNRYAIRVAEKLPGPQDLASGLTHG